MAVSSVTIHAAVFTTLIRICRITHAYIWAIHFIDNGFWKNVNIFRFVGVSNLTRSFAIIQKIVPLLMAKFKKTVVDSLLGASAVLSIGIAMGHKKTLKDSTLQS